MSVYVRDRLMSPYIHNSNKVGKPFVPVTLCLFTFAYLRSFTRARGRRREVRELCEFTNALLRSFTKYR